MSTTTLKLSFNYHQISTLSLLPFAGMDNPGMDNSSYNGLDPPGTVKRNPTYLESPSASDMESMSVTMTLSAEDILSQVVGNCGSHNFLWSPSRKDNS